VTTSATTNPDHGFKTKAPLPEGEQSFTDKLLAMAKNGDFNGAAALLGKSMARKNEAPEAPGPLRLGGAGNPGMHQPNTGADFQQLIQGLKSRDLEKRLLQKQAQRRRQQDRYDFNNMGGR
jgi:hypothetical protein